MEILGVVLALAGLAFAFETPRKAFVKIFSLDRFKSTRSKQAKSDFAALNLPITSSSIILYLKTSSNSLDLDNQIASDQGSEPKDLSGDGKWLIESIEKLGITKISELDEIVRKHSTNARLLAHAFDRSKSPSLGDGIVLVLEIEAMDRFGSAWYENYLSKLNLSSTGPGYASDLLEFYETIRQIRN